MGAPKLVSSEVVTVTGATQYSAVYSLPRGDTVSFHYVYTLGTGTATVQYSNVNDTAAFQSVTTTTQTLSGTGVAFFDIIKTGAAFARLIFSSATNSTGTLYVNKR